MAEEIKIEMSEPAPCPECGKGHLLAFLRPRFKDEGMYNPKPTQFSHYQVYYRCSNELCGHQIEG